MVPIDRLLAFAAAAFVLIVIPGPSVLFEISRSVALGRRAGLATVAGNTFGELVQATAVAVGIGAIIQRSAPLSTLVKVIGVAYIIVLGFRAMRDRRTHSNAFDTAMIPRSDRRIFFEGFAVGATDPKSLVFFAAILPQFVVRTPGRSRRSSCYWDRCSWRSRWSPTARGSSWLGRRGTGSHAHRGGSRWCAEPAG